MLLRISPSDLFKIRAVKKLTTLLLLCVAPMVWSQEIVDQLEFKGLKRTKESFLRRLMNLGDGKPLDTVLIKDDVERLNRLPGIAKASYKIQKNGDDTVLTYDIVENFTIIPGLRVSQANDGEGGIAFRTSIFDFNLFGNNQLFGGFFERDVFNSWGVFWEHPFLFSNKAGIGVNYQDLTTFEPVFFPGETTDYQFNAQTGEVQLLISADFKNEAEFGVAFLRETYNIIGDNPIANTPAFVESDKLVYRGVYRYVDLDIDYQYIDGVQSEFTGQYFQFLEGSAQAEEFLGAFVSLRNDLLWFKRVGKRGNWASRVRLAAAFGNEDSAFAPFTLDNQINIRGVGNTVDRGTASAVLNTEYRHTFFERDWFVVQGNAFVDAGSWRLPGEEFSQLFEGSTTRLAPGLGFRLIHKRIFNAVFRLDYGFGVGSEATSGVVFGIGQFF